jgi:hypothetical protein
MHGPAGKRFDFPDHLLGGGVQGHENGVVGRMLITRQRA